MPIVIVPDRALRERKSSPSKIINAPPRNFLFRKARMAKMKKRRLEAAATIKKTVKGFSIWITSYAPPFPLISFPFYDQAKYSLILLTFQLSSSGTPEKKTRVLPHFRFDKFF